MCVYHQAPANSLPIEEALEVPSLAWDVLLRALLIQGSPMVAKVPFGVTLHHPTTVRVSHSLVGALKLRLRRYDGILQPGRGATQRLSEAVSVRSRWPGLICRSERSPATNFAPRSEIFWILLANALLIPGKVGFTLVCRWGRNTARSLCFCSCLHSRFLTPIISQASCIWANGMRATHQGQSREYKAFSSPLKPPHPFCLPPHP